MSKFDKDLKVGDIIRAYDAGIHKVTKIKQRFYDKNDESLNYGKLGEEYNSLIYYETILNSKLKKADKRQTDLCCDAFCCVKLNKKDIEQELLDKLNKLTDGYGRLLDLLND